tara:strand:- start:19887 stop:20306 length:420 start_codon:yes stop_codon:yes gene_type:complete
MLRRIEDYLSKIRFPNFLLYFLCGVLPVTIFLVGINYGWSGIYYIHSADIYVKAKGKPIADVENTLYHELGHHIWITMLSDSEKTYYRRLANTTINDVGEQFARDFALFKTNIFAEKKLGKEMNLYFYKIIKKYKGVRR